MKNSSFDKLKEFVNNNPKDETARYNFAVMCEQLNHIDLAKDHYNKILKKILNTGNQSLIYI